MPIREELFTHRIACPMGTSLEDKEIQDRWKCLHDHYFPDAGRRADLGDISTDEAEVARRADWDILLGLAARHSVEWCNDFICSLTTKTIVAENPVYGIDDRHLSTLLRLKKDFQLQSCDLSSPMFEQGSLFNPGSLHHTLDQQSLATMARSLAKPPNDGKFNRIFLDEVSDFLFILSTESLDLIKQLTQKKVFNFCVFYQAWATNNSERHTDACFKEFLLSWSELCSQSLEEIFPNNDDYSDDDEVFDSIVIDVTPLQALSNIVRYGFTKDSFPLAMLVYGDESTNGFIQFNRAIYYHIQLDSLQKKAFENIRAELTDGSPKYIWLDDSRYQDEDSLYILYRLAIAFDENETSENAKSSGPDRLQFYHDHHRLSALIKYIKEGRLSIAEVAQYDKFEVDKIPPRMLPRLLAGDLDEGITLSQAEIVAYELHDYDPKNNPHRHELLTEEAFRQPRSKGDETYYSELYKTYRMTHARDDQHIATYFDTILKPVVAERARLYLDLQRLKKQEQELGPGPLTWPQWFYYLFYKTPTQECVLVSAKIALFSGAIEGMQNCIRAVENLTDKKRVAGSTSILSGELSSNDSTYLYALGNSRPDALTLYANGNYLKENFGANAIESTQFPIDSRNHSVSENISKYAVALKAEKKLLTHSVVMLKEEDAEPTSCAKGMIQIKICSANPDNASVYWTEGQILVKKTFKYSALFDGISNNLPKPGESSNNPILHQKISTICDYNCEERWLTREKATVNYARDHVATFFKGLIGAIFCIPAGVIGLACPSFANSFNAIFFGTRSLNCLKQAETARETLKQQMSVDLSVEYP